VERRERGAGAVAEEREILGKMRFGEAEDNFVEVMKRDFAGVGWEGAGEK
jgi:hypothetical protein